MRNKKLFFVFATIVLLFIALNAYDQYRQIRKTQEMVVQNESVLLGSFITVFRQTYQDVFVQEHIAINDRTLNLLPVKTMTEINRRFTHELKNNTTIRIVSDRPRNPDNRANAFEEKKIDYFGKHPEKSEEFVRHGDVFNYLQPMRIKTSCLRCHGSREKSIPSIRDRYAKAYNYSEGDIRGLVNIEIRDTELFKTLYFKFIGALLMTLALYIIFMVIIYTLMRKIQLHEERYTHQLKENIASKTHEIAQQKETFETLFEKSSDGILIIDNHHFVQCNEKAVEMIGYDSKASLLKTHPSKLSPEFQPDGQASFEKANHLIERALDEGVQQFEWIHRRADGTDFWVDVHLAPISLNGRQVVYVIWRDITRRKEAEKKLSKQKKALYFQAHHDGLTGLPNRTRFVEQIERDIRKMANNNQELALFFIDLDHFKQINDSLGHDAGDKVLLITAERLKAKMRKHDFVARLGGDEFVVILKDFPSIEGVSTMAEKILEVLRQPIHLDGQTLYLSCSIGISLYPRDDQGGTHLIKYADAAMYQAKGDGRNTYRFYRTEMTDIAYERIIMKADMRKGLDNEEFVVYFQPQVHVATQKLVGMEALVRWEHPAVGQIPPGKFIPIAEETGMMIEIDRQVMGLAMGQIAAWREQGLDPGTLALNLTLSHLGTKDFFDNLKSQMGVFDFRPEWLELEITENEAMKNHEEAIKKLRQISRMGIRVAVDDFGKGHSSLAYLKRLPIDRLKIDRSFVQDIPKGPADAAIIKAIISLTKHLDLDVIAEGVERPEQRDFLLENGCDVVQGFLCGKPMPAEKMESLLREQQTKEKA